MGSVGELSNSYSTPESGGFDLSQFDNLPEEPAIDYGSIVGRDYTYTPQDFLDRNAVPLGPADARMLNRDPRYANYLAYTNNGAFNYPFSDPYFAGFRTGGNDAGEMNTPPADLYKYTPMSYAQWLALANSLNAAVVQPTPPTPPVIPPVTPPVTSPFPSYMPPNGQAVYDKYKPFPFTREANTPGVTYTKPSLTYNNPYNTNPYLPLSNPFALIANNTGNTNG